MESRSTSRICSVRPVTNYPPYKETTIMTEGPSAGDNNESASLLRHHDPHPRPGDRIAASRWFLFFSYCMAAWAWRFADFLYALLMIHIYPSSLILVSVYGLLDNGVRLVLGSHNGCIAVSTAFAAVLLVWVLPKDDSNADWDEGTYKQVAEVNKKITSRFGLDFGGSRLGSSSKPLGLTITYDRPSHNSYAGMRSIDLTSSLLAPILAGSLMTFYSQTIAVLVLCCNTLAAWVPELLLLSWAVKCSSALRGEADKGDSAPYQESSTTASGQLSEDPNPNPDPVTVTDRPDYEKDVADESLGVAKTAKGFKHAWLTYCKQEVLLANLSLATLYCTVLSLGFLMTAYLRWSGMNEAEVSLYRALGGLAGLLATGIFWPLRSWLGSRRTGLAGIYYQLICLCLGIIPVIQHSLFSAKADDGSVEPPSALLIRLMLAGVVASRTGLWLFDLSVTQLVQELVPHNELGLWIFDLSVTQLVQELVPHNELGVVSGVQGSLQAAFETIQFLAGLYCADPSLFYLLLIGSMVIVAVATAMFTVYACGCLASGRSSASIEYAPLAIQESLWGSSTDAELSPTTSLLGSTLPMQARPSTDIESAPVTSPVRPVQ
eukprot:gene6629-3285_t